MAITTIDQLLAGMQPPVPYIKVGTAWGAAGRLRSHLYDVGAPGAAAVPAPGIAGAALTTYAGQLPFTNPGSGNQYLARLSGALGNAGQIYLLDRLWHNSGNVVTQITSQTVNSVAWPARDNDGTTNGDGILIAMEVSTAMGVGAGNLTLNYTNEAGTAGRSSVTAYVASQVAGQWLQLNLQGGDKGVRSIQSYTLSVSMTSGVFHLVAYRVLAVLELPNPNTGAAVDGVTGGLPRLYDNTVPFLVTLSNSNGAANLSGNLVTSVG